MRHYMSLPQAKFLAGLFTNLAAGWYGVVFIAPGFDRNPWILLQDLLFAIVFSWLAVKLEEAIITYEQ